MGTTEGGEEDCGASNQCYIHMSRVETRCDERSKG